MNKKGADVKPKVWDDWEQAAEEGLEPVGLDEIKKVQSSKNVGSFEILSNNSRTEYVPQVRVLSRSEKEQVQNPTSSGPLSAPKEAKDYAQRLSEYEKARERIFNSKDK